MKVPVLVVCSIICLGLGAVAGVAGIMIFGPKLAGVHMTVAIDRPGAQSGEPGKGGPPMGKGMPGGKGMAGGKGMPGGGKGGGKGMPDMAKMMMGMMKGKGGPLNPKTQLDTLIVKLDLLTQKPLKIDLSKEVAKKVAAALVEVSKGDTSEDDAKKHLDILLEALKDYKDTLTAAGFRWPSAENGADQPGASPADMPKHLKSLEERLTK
jgi:hypothetical protein